MNSEELGQINDGFHTFDELYEHRSVLFIALMKLRPHYSWWADEHEDGSMFPGYFIAGIENAQTGPITYHLKIDPWRRMLEELPPDSRPLHLERAMRWDGHTPADVVDRLKKWIAII